MILEGKLQLKAPIQTLWDKLLEPETLQACIPGAEKIERVDEKTYDRAVSEKDEMQIRTEILQGGHATYCGKCQAVCPVGKP